MRSKDLTTRNNEDFFIVSVLKGGYYIQPMYSLQTVTKKYQKKEFISFIYKVYHENDCFIDMQVQLVKTFLYNKDSFTNKCVIQPIVINKDKEQLAQCVFIYHKDLPVLQVAFFEAKENCRDAVAFLLEAAKEKANELGLKKIVVGLNGHVSYGVGLLESHFDHRITFDSNYNPEYYHDYFRSLHLNKKTLHTYYFKIQDPEINKNILNRVYRDITYRTLDMKSFKNEMLIFGDLCNKALKGTYLYFEREPFAMFQMIKQMKFFLQSDNLIFAYKGSKPIGFLFWHPDYNEIFSRGRQNSVFDYCKSFLFRKNKIKGVKLNVIGVLPEYQNTSVVFGLIDQFYQKIKKNFDYGETNFVWDNNLKSSLLNKAITDTPFRKYCIYEYDIL